MKYLAVKLKDFSYWIWFEIEKVERVEGRFVGTEGWGRGGTRTDLDIKESLIDGEMKSNELQYV